MLELIQGALLSEDHLVEDNGPRLLAQKPSDAPWLNQDVNLPKPVELPSLSDVTVDEVLQLPRCGVRAFFAEEPALNLANEGNHLVLGHLSSL